MTNSSLNALVPEYAGLWPVQEKTRKRKLYKADSYSGDLRT